MDMIANKIKTLRIANNLTQAEVARHLGITRSSVNAWEMGISIPSTTCVISLAHLFRVSTDYILDMEYESVLDISGLDDASVQILTNMLRYIKTRQG